MSNLSEQHLTEIRELLDGGQKLAAVKVYKNATGKSLAQSKHDVESIAAGKEIDDNESVPEIDSDLTDSQMDKVLDALNSGNFVLAIKHYRDASGQTLKDSKTVVESLADQLGVERPKGCMSIVLLVITLGATAAATLV